MEQFVKCLFSDSHLIGDMGNVKTTHAPSIKRYGTDILRGLIKSDGYKMYFICGKWYYAHRLVASHYILNPGNLSDVNHKDGNKAYNWVENLEWVSHRDNIQHSYDVLGRTNPKGVDRWNYGLKASEETKNKMAVKKLGKLHPKFKGWYVFDGVEYATPDQLAKILTISRKTVVRYCVNGFFGCSFRYK